MSRIDPPAADLIAPRLVLNNPDRMAALRRSPAGRRRKNLLFVSFCVLVAMLSLVILAVLLLLIFIQGAGGLDWSFLTSPPNPDPAQAGLYPALFGTIWICAVCAAAALPLGVASAIFLEEYQPRRRWFRAVHQFIQLNIANLAGVPSVVYGIVGLTAFTAMFGLFGTPRNPALEWGVTYHDQYFNEAYQVLLVPVEGPNAPQATLRPGMTAFLMEMPDAPEGIDPNTLDPVRRQVRLNVIGPDEAFPDDPALAARTVRTTEEPGRIDFKEAYYFRLPFGRGVLAGGLTLMLVILPVVIIATQESLRAVPDSLREGALGMGATRWQMIYRVTLPAAVPGIMTGSIIAMSRAIGEAAPLLMIAGIVFITTAPRHLMDDFTAMPLQIYNWAGRPQQSFHDVAASGIIILLAVLLLFNGLAVLIRHRFQKRLG